MPTDQKQKPDNRGVAQDRMAPAVEICRDVYGGTLTMRKKATKYLPKFEREEAKDYNSRVDTAVLFNAFRRSVKGLVGMIFRKPVELGDDVPKKLQSDAENIDMAGRHLDVFARDLAESAWIDGHACVLVDMQAVDPGELPTLADEREFGLRPYWVLIRKDQVLRVRTITAGGRMVLSRFAYKETVTEDDGEYGEKEVERVRDYRLVSVVPKGERRPRVMVAYIIHTKRQKAAAGEAEWDSEPERYMSINRIPVATHYTSRTAFMESEPPLLDLALENVLHYQTRSDRQNVLHIASVPIPVFKGLRAKEGETQVGVNSAITVDTDGDAFYLEPEGKALDHSQQELKDIEGRMAALGLSQLMSDSRAAETARSKEIDKSESDSALMAAARDLEDCLEAALEIHAAWLEEKSGGSVSVNRDFIKQQMDPQMIQALAALVAEGRLSDETLWDMLVRGDILPASFDPELEKDRISQGGLGTLELARTVDPERQVA